MLQATVRQTDVVARLGGDEFVVLLHDVGPQAMVSALAGKIVCGIAQPCEVLGARVHVGTSIGIAIYPDHARSREGLLKAADQAMYVAKTHGKGGYRFSGAGE
jgi:diguanylate cyclase (GGDEF)-like protein